ncbi:Receptor homology region, transmembrane domain-and RING domain-containing protein 2 [Geodia barretti]|uniref:Receptor homology region, transmembrane domain-and RING domain-containing protein 2 n=1 Tax=Geodia barretti TaxID=519541 RepID=A0AA35WBQ4_GEOBA|nr:Receptor homology region, transmembrane domain-and RING domain-containing protein 2 [Geodia barretti]
MQFLVLAPEAIVLVFLGLLASPSWQYVTIELKNNSRSLGDRYKYEDDSVFTYRYANFPGNGKLSGYVWRWSDLEFPTNGCQYIDPLSYDVQAEGSRWFALIEGLSTCAKDMVQNVRNAGFDLVIGYDNGSSSAPDLSSSLRDSDFPIVAISSGYAEKLLEIAATDSQTGSVRADVSVVDLDDLVVGFSVGFLVLSLALFTLFFCFVYCRWRARRRGLYSFPATGGRDPLQQRFTRARLERQELIESILRQLQELHIEPGRHPPLGEEATRALPQKKFSEVALRESSSSKETCAICVEEFQAEEVVRVLPCSHFFHPNCIDPWLTEHSSMCPLCKQSVSQQNEQPPGVPGAPYEVNPLSSSSASSLSIDTESLENFATPTAVTPVPPPLESPTFAVQVRGSSASVNDDSLSSASSDAPLITSTNR